MSDFSTVTSRHAYRGFSSVRLDEVTGPGGRFQREVVEHPDAVAIVALDGAGRAVVVRQYRHPLGQELLELPAGTLDVEGEAPVDAAHRELAEEVGLAADALEPLGTVWNSAGWSDERTLLFLARRTRPTAAPHGYTPRDEEAVMRAEWHPLEDLATAALDGRIEDAKTAIGVLRARAVLAGGAREVGPDDGADDATD